MRPLVGTPNLESLLLDYRRAAEHGILTAYRKRTWCSSKEFGSWLAQEALPDLTEPKALQLYMASGGAKVKEFSLNSIEEIRDTIDFLLYDPIKLEGRFYECAAKEGSYKLKGAGKEFVSYLLCLKDPQLFGVWNAAAEKGLGLLGLFPCSLKTGHLGARYVELLDVLWQLRRFTRLPDFRAVDEFLYALAKGIIFSP